jgi:hypothetical protein
VGQEGLPQKTTHSTAKLSSMGGFLGKNSFLACRRLEPKALSPAQKNGQEKNQAVACQEKS